jgi:glycosyltransferase involved in cell wall biosynthesis
MIPSRPRVSIGLPVYNGEEFIAAALNAVLAQTYGDFELIIADNASTDGTADVCQSYAAKDRRIRWVRNATNIGASRNANLVVHLSTGDYFKLACADDLFHAELVARCVDVMDADPTVVAVYPKTRFIDRDGGYLDLTDPGWHLMWDSPVARLRYVIASGHSVNVFSGGLIRRQNLAHTRLFPLYAGGDCALLGELCLMGKFFEISEYLFFRRIHTRASSQNTDLGWQSTFFKGRPGLLEMPFWHVCVDHARTIVCSRLSARDKLVSLGHVFSRMYSGKRELVCELRAAWKYLYRTKLLNA